MRYFFLHTCFVLLAFLSNLFPMICEAIFVYRLQVLICFSFHSKNGQPIVHTAIFRYIFINVCATLFCYSWQPYYLNNFLLSVIIIYDCLGFDFQLHPLKQKVVYHTLCLFSIVVLVYYRTLINIWMYVMYAYHLQTHTTCTKHRYSQSQDISVALVKKIVMLCRQH